MLDLSALPADVRALIASQAATIARQDAELDAHRTLVETLRLQLARLRRMQFGRSSEKLDTEIAQLTLALKELEADTPCPTVPPLADSTAAPGTASARPPARRPLPPHLPRLVVTHETACFCPSCGGALRPLGEDVTEVLDHVPALFRVIRHVRPKFSCRSCETIVQAPAPELPIRRGRGPSGPAATAMMPSSICATAGVARRW